MKYPVDRTSKVVKNDNKEIIADKLHAYLQHHLSLVNWAEQSLVNGFYEDDAAHTIGNILSQLRLADVKAFGLE